MIRRRTIVAAVPLLLLDACSSAPPINYYKLAVLPGAQIQTQPTSIVIRPISLPEYLDQSGVTKPGTAYQTGTYQNELWAEPLADLLRDVLVQELAQRLPAATVLGSGGAIAPPAGLVLELNVLEFDQALAGMVTLKVQFAFKSETNRSAAAIHTIDLPVPVAAVGAAATVAAMSSLWAAAADEIAHTAATQTSQAPPG